MCSRKSKLAIFINVIVFLSVAVVAGCVAKAKGPNFQMEENVPSNKALVYFYRPYKGLGAALSDMAIADNGNIICTNILMNGYCVSIAEPGNYKFHTVSPIIDKVKEVVIKPGDKLYFKVIHQCGVWACSHTLYAVDENLAIEELASFKLQY